MTQPAPDTAAGQDGTAAGIGSAAAGTDIAIVGMSGRFPGAADIAGLWAEIRAARSGITRFTADELRAAGVTDDVLADPGYVRAGAVLDGIDLFDADFFGLGPKEAQILDPQQRLYLEHNWHALEDAGCDPSSFDGAIGVFGGCAFSTYLQNNLVPSGIAAVLGDLAVGLANDKDSLTTRVAHTLGLSGPTYSVQSYCSTSLVAVCAAATSLAGFECDLALAGGVAVFVPHRVGYLFQPGGIAPPDGECRAFDEAGLGSPLGSGVGVVALRRLEDALAAGDRVYAVIRGWAVNNDGGRAAGFTAPSVQGQASVIAEALSSAGLSAADIDYVEAHGTGTALGDAVELAALQQVFGGEECLIGSIKTNVGHLDRAAGVTGLIKTALALHNAEIPPTRNLADPNRQLRVGAARLEVVTELTDWQRRGDRIRRAGVSAFGIGGTNAHVVLEQAPAIPRPEPAPRPEVLVWSARSAAAADEMTRRLAGHLTAESGALCDVAYTLQSGRRVFEHRRMLVASTGQDAALRMRGAGVQGQRESRGDRQVGFLIAGAGEQYPGMAADLYRGEPSFAAVLDQCRAILTGRPDGVDPLDEMLSPRPAGDAAGYGLSRLLGRDAVLETGPGESTDRLHPAMFAVEYALARLVMSWGIEPVVMAGYSLGEYVAACLSGVLTLESALALVTHRARLITALPAGAMAAVPLSEAEMRRRIERAGTAGVDIAAVNGTELTVIAGQPAAVSQIRALLEAEAVPSRALATTHAFHSRMLEPIKAALTEWVAGNIPLGAPRIPYVSNLTGSLVTAEQAADPGYWAEHMCSPVRFDAGLKTLLDQPDVALLELGPGQSLGAMVRGHSDCPPDRWRLVMPSLPAAGDSRGSGIVLAEAAGRLWLAGVPFDWDAYRAGRQAAKTGLPGYPFQRQRYWIDPPAGPRPTAPPAAEPEAGSRPRDGHVLLMRQQWTETAISGDPTPTGPCVLLGADPVADLLAASLRADGADVVRADPDSDRAALAECFSRTRPSTVIDLRVLGRPDSAADGRDVVLPFAVMADALGSAGDDTASVILVTRGGQAIASGDSPEPAQAATAGLAMVANQEYLNVECRVVDLDPRADPAAAVRALMAECGCSSRDVLVGYRGGLRNVRGFGPADALPSASAVAIRPGGTYLITGGLGDVGLQVAGHLVSSGASRLVLTSRRGGPATAEDPRHAAVSRLRGLGAEVVTPPVDVTDEAGMRAVLAETLRDGGRLDGVIHAAADTRPETFFPLRYLAAEAVAQHFGAKVTGARVLETLLTELPEASAPDFCLLFSSTSSVLGGIAFGSYAAANAALTAIGHANHAAGTPTRWIAASWDTWAQTLERTGGGIGATMAAHAMTAREGLDAFDLLLAGPEPGPIVVAAGLDDRMPRVSAIPDQPGASADRFPRPDLPQPYAPPLTATDRALAELWSGVLGVEPVGTDDNFFDLGGSSLLALQMLMLVKKRFGIILPAVTLFEAPTVHTLAAILDSKGTVTQLAPASVTSADRPVSAGIAVPSRDVAQPAPAALAERHSPARAGIDRRIAIVGMAGRFPGAGSADAFWQNLRDGVESISFFAEDELIASGEEPSLIHDPGYVPARPVLDDISGFDAAFFGLSSRTAALTDPQQRIFLEVCWEALEQAGYAAPEHRGRVGVFGGCNISTYLLRMPQETFTGGEISTYEIVMSNDKDALTTTVSYLFDLHGPSVAVQTFCSTSLVATHLAVQSLRAGECEMAMAGGVSIRVPDRVGHLFQPGGMESPDGHVRTFDAKAHGSMVGDGAAVVVLKRLADAVRDGDHIWSVILGSAINNDGALKVGYTAPSVTGQARVIADAMADAEVCGEDISYVEAHGTATELGDPIELAALGRAFGPTTQNQYCPIGSVKTNVGHLDRAAGVTGLIKTSFALTHEVIPPSLHYTSPNPDIDFAGSPFYVNTELAPWRTRDGRRRLAGINSLGMGGTNVHVVLGQAPVRSAGGPGRSSPRTSTAVGREDSHGRRYQVLPVSARSAAAATQACGQLGERLHAVPGTRLADVAYTLQAGRKVFEHRRAVVAADTSQAADLLSGTGPADGLMSRVDAVRGRPVAFLFTGAGEQYPGMIAELYLREPVFRAAADECLDVLRQTLPAVDLVDLLTGSRGAGMTLAAMLGKSGGSGGSDDDSRSSGLERTEVVQPALFAVEYALARTLMTWGVRPQAMLGYSIGEYVAACLAGVFSLADALALVVRRAKLIARAAPGSMVAVPLPARELRSRFSLAERELDVAAVNGPAITVVAGPVGAVSDFVAELRLADVPCRALQTTHAFHSRMLDHLSDELTGWVRANITLQAPQLPYISNLTGGYADAGLVCDPGYWARHMCQTVQFEAGVQTLAGEPELAVVEIGPGQSLGAMIRAAGCPPERWPLILSVLPAAADSRPDDAVVASCLAKLWLLGVDIDWVSYHGRDLDPAAASAAMLPGRIPLPTYPFQRQRYWFDGPPRVSPPARPAGALPLPGDAPSVATLDAIAGLPKLPEEQWLHLPVWRQTAAPAAAAAQPACWLVYTRDGVADDVVAELGRTVTPAGAVLRLVRPGEAYAATDGGYLVRPGSVDDASSMLRDLRAGGLPLERVVHLWSIDAAQNKTAQNETAPNERALADGLHTIVALARAAGGLGLDAWSLDVVASGTQQVQADDPASPYAATLTGPCRVIPLEYPGVTTRLIDVTPDAAPAAVGALVGELCRPQADPMVALRPRRRWVPGYEAMAAGPAAGRGVLRQGGVYLITGGLGGIGLAMAAELARECQAKLVLLGRHGLPERATWPGILRGGPEAEQSDATTRQRVAKVAALLDLGAEVEIVTGDVSDRDDVGRACQVAVERFGALHGVLHVAGVPSMGLMQFKGRRELDAELASKVAGTMALGEALRIGRPDETRLDFLVLFSSITSTTGGGPGQVGYCAANAFLDAYACQLAATGRKAVAIDWSEWTWNAWDDGLTGYADALQAFFRANRARIGIDFDAGWRSLLRVLASDEPRVIVSTQDFPTMVRFGAQFTVAAVTSRALAGSGSRHSRPELMTPYQEPSNPIEESIAGIWCEALRLEQVGVQDSFFDLGGNSLLGVSIVAALRTAFALADLPPHILYEAPTVAALGKVIEVASAGGPSGAAPGEESDRHVRAQLRRSGLEASAARRRGR